MMQKVLFLTTAHHFDDDRIFYHQALTLLQKGFQVKISSISSDFQGMLQGAEIEAVNILSANSSDKMDFFLRLCQDFAPDCIIASEPLAVVAAGKYAIKHRIPVIYDITEWYPSKRMLEGFSLLKRTVKFIQFTLIQLLAGWYSSHFIYGEKSKLFPLERLFWWKKKLSLPYYPSKKFVHSGIHPLKDQEITLCYTGRISEEDGIENFFKVVKNVMEKRPAVTVKVLLIGAPKKTVSATYLNSLLRRYQLKNIEIIPPVPFLEFSRSLAHADLCFDLRENNAEYSNSFPIKIFYYIGSGKPVIYTFLKALKDRMNLSAFGHLVDPEDVEGISDIVINYINSPQKYLMASECARASFDQKYNWELLEDAFVAFVTKTISG